MVAVVVGWWRWAMAVACWVATVLYWDEFKKNIILRYKIEK